MRDRETVGLILFASFGALLTAIAAHWHHEWVVVMGIASLGLTYMLGLWGNE